jgi:hypothetical protein
MNAWLRRALLFAVLGFAAGASSALAHEFKLDSVITTFVTVEPGEAHMVVRAPLYLFKSVHFPIRNAEVDIPQSGPALERAIAAIEHDIVLLEDGQPLTAARASARLSLPSDRSFLGYGEALQHLAEPVAPDTQIYVDQGFVDAHIVYPIKTANPELSIRSTAAPEFGDALKLTVRYKPLEGEARSLIMNGGVNAVALNPTAWNAAKGFIALGMEHILTGFDHLLFLLCLIIPLRGWRPILAIVTTFTVAHSFTLIGSAFHLAPGGAWFPPFVETTIAASIVYMALENIMGIDFARRMLITGMFGLVHGFGFSYGLQENLQFAGTHLITSLFAFNVGIELGQITVLVFMIPALLLVRRYVLPGRTGMIILSSLVGLTAWQWMLDRGQALLNAPWPRPTVAGLATLAFWFVGILLAAGGLRLVANRLSGPMARAITPMHRGSAD